MPWTKKQQDTARAVEHGWKPKGAAKGFTQDVAEQVMEESKHMKTRPSVKRKKMHKPMTQEEMRKKRAEMMLGKGARAAG